MIDLEEVTKVVKEKRKKESRDPMFEYGRLWWIVPVVLFWMAFYLGRFVFDLTLRWWDWPATISYLIAFIISFVLAGKHWAKANRSAEDRKYNGGRRR